ncbi:hypothetical protein EscoHU1_064 [Escherichia phage EscoHU1]|uniref:Uncharacterized protein n=1 Tax=Escherichia phage EscoHU1 TaxID=2881221 RepID=A0AAD1KX75_9CAUD|nr:hypothetical protein EscoHU1_064 [Escherichia phage EscoHU1]
MTTRAIARLEADRDNLINNIKVWDQEIENQKLTLIQDMQQQNARREALKEVKEAIEKLKAE